jgi:hypothetical protein
LLRQCQEIGGTLNVETHIDHVSHDEHLLLVTDRRIKKTPVGTTIAADEEAPKMLQWRSNMAAVGIAVSTSIVIAVRATNGKKYTDFTISTQQMDSY